MDKIKELSHRLLDLPLTTLVLEVQDCYYINKSNGQKRSLRKIVAKHVHEFCLYLTSNNSDNGGWISDKFENNETYLDRCIDEFNTTTTRVNQVQTCISGLLRVIFDILYSTEGTELYI